MIDKECFNFLNDRINNGQAKLIDSLRIIIEGEDFISLVDFLKKWKLLADYNGFTLAPWKLDPKHSHSDRPKGYIIDINYKKET